METPNLVNVTSILGKTRGADLGTGSDTDISLTNGSSSNKVLKINSIIVANVDGSNVNTTVTCSFYDGSATARYKAAFS